MRRVIGVLSFFVAIGILMMGCRANLVLAEPAAQPKLAKVKQEVDAPAFPVGLQWLNTAKPLTLADLRGKVVLLDFWTYCCINCIHTIPDLKKLEAKYANELVVIGVHSAKFENEKEATNIREAILRYEIEHPVANDKDFLFWRSYGVQAWPTLVLIDPDGKLIGAASGEGHYEVLDARIGELVKDFGAKNRLNRTPMKWELEKGKRAPSILSYPGKITADAKSKRLFFSDSNHNRIIITSLEGKIQEVIGDGKIGLKDGDFTNARFFRPQGLCYDPETDRLYVADTNNHAIRRIDLKAQKVTTIVGNGKKGGYPPRGGTGKNATPASPWDVLLMKNYLYVANAGTHQLWRIDLKTMSATPYAGTGGENIVDGFRSEALLAQPSGLATNGTSLFFADSEVSAVRALELQRGQLTTLIGQGLFEFGDIDGKYPQARLQHPIGVAYHDDYVYVADTYNHKIKRVDPKKRTLETFIGTGKRGTDDGAAKQASLNEPNGMVFVGEKLYIADTNNHAIRVFDLKTQKLSTLKLTGLEKVPVN